MIRMTKTSARAGVALGAVAATTLLSAGPANAEIFGLLNGRSAAPPTWQTAVEAGAEFSDDVLQLAVRGNYALNPTLTAFANLGFIDFDDGGDGFQIGGGAFLHLTEQRVVPNLDVAIKPSVGFADVDGGNVLTLAGEALVSGREPLGGGSLGWYANVGLGLFRADPDNGSSDTDLEPILGGGITLPVGTGTFYAGIDFIDEIGIGAGFRVGL